MNGEMKDLNDTDYQTTYDISEIKELQYSELSQAKVEVESELRRAFDVLQKVSRYVCMKF